MGFVARLVAPTIMLLSILQSSCGSEVRAETNEEDGGVDVCAQAQEYLASCGAERTYDCQYGDAPGVVCDAECVLERSCEYHLGENPEENLDNTMCGSGCTCEAAQRRALECGLFLAIDCTEFCNCPYYYGCDGGVQEYAACRETCPQL